VLQKTEVALYAPHAWVDIEAIYQVKIPPGIFSVRSVTSPDQYPLSVVTVSANTRQIDTFVFTSMTGAIRFKQDTENVNSSGNPKGTGFSKAQQRQRNQKIIANNQAALRAKRRTPRKLKPAQQESLKAHEQEQRKLARGLMAELSRGKQPIVEKQESLPQCDRRAYPKFCV
jgi:hypothetical protein